MLQLNASSKTANLFDLVYYNFEMFSFLSVTLSLNLIAFLRDIRFQDYPIGFSQSGHNPN